MIRLQKLLAQAGLGSRRTVEEWIRAGRITIGGRTAQLGERASTGDDVRLDGRRLALGETGGADELLLYYKPVGEVTTRGDPERRPTVFERLPPARNGRWIAVGRLDVNTSGLLLLTTDGELAHRLMHPSSEVEREYLVRLRGWPGPRVIESLLRGVMLEDGPARFDRIHREPEPQDAGSRRAPGADSRARRPGAGSQRIPGAAGSHSTFRVVLHEGRHREVRRLWQAAGFEVSRLLRIRYGPVELPRDLRPGSARWAEVAVLESLRKAAERPASGSGRAARPARDAPAPTPSTGRPVSLSGRGRRPSK